MLNLFFGIFRDSATNFIKYAREKLDFCHCARWNVNVRSSVRFSGIVRRTGNNIKKRNFDASVDGIYDSPFVAGGADAFMHFRGSDFLPSPLETKLIGKGFRGVETFFSGLIPFPALLFHSCSSEMIIRRFLLSRRSHHYCARSVLPLPLR